MSKSALWVLAVVLPSLAFAAPARKAVHPVGAPPAADEQTRARMDGMLATIRIVQPFVSRPEAFSAPESEEAVKALLDALARDAKGLEHLETMRGPGMKVSADVLVDHVQRTAVAFRSGRKEQARWMLNTTIHGCIACHSQLPANSVRPILDEASLTGTPLEQADLLLASRQFEEAAARYLDVVTSADWTAASTRRDVETALRRLLAIDLRVRRSVQAAKFDVRKARSARGLPDELQQLLSAWETALARPELSAPIDPARVKPPALAKWTKKVLGSTPPQPAALANPAQAVPLLLASGVLYEFLSKNPAGGEVSTPLLDLARCDRALNGDWFFSLADLYLQTCVRRAAKTPLARRCYDELKASVEFQFTGSRGADVPDDQRKLLEDLAPLAP